jgi:hypothetical protein
MLVSNSIQFGKNRFANIDYGGVRASGAGRGEGIILRGSQFWRFYE